MKSILFLSILLNVHISAVEPFEPRTVPNAPRQTLPVSLHPDLTSMLVFPDPILMIVGAGLTDGTLPGLVQFDHRKGSAVVTFRPLQTEQAVFAQIIAGETVYFCRLKPETRPDSVVTISASDGSSPRAVPLEDVFSQRLDIPRERLKQFIELARSSSVLSKSIPDEYDSSQAIKVEMAYRSGALETRIEKIHRFPKSDTLVFFGTITNRGPVPAAVSWNRFRLIVGESRRMVPNLTSAINKSLGAGETIGFECVLAGDGEGNRMNLSIRNRFALEVSAISKP